MFVIFAILISRGYIALSHKCPFDLTRQIRRERGKRDLFTTKDFKGNSILSRFLKPIFCDTFNTNNDFSEFVETFSLFRNTQNLSKYTHVAKSFTINKALALQALMH